MPRRSGKRAVACCVLLLGAATLSSTSFAAAPPQAPLRSASSELRPGHALAGCTLIQSQPGPRTPRRLFDSGSFFGVGVPEALVVALLGWFLLGPEELYKISKQIGGWLGELRTYIGQAARQYESALDDTSTRQAIEGIRQTQQTVSELAGSWRSVTDSLRDPLAISSTLQSTLDKYSGPKDAAKDTLESVKAKKPALDIDSTDEAKEKAADSDEDETEEELEEKIAKSRAAASDLWYKPEDGSSDSETFVLPQKAEAFLARLDRRLEDIESLGPELDSVQKAAARLDELRKGVLEDRAAIRQIVKDSAREAKEASTENLQDDVLQKAGQDA
mmetsp:Transcript_10664/g.20015  ORF Transcript_10664/g.20015 Transcript_10664/m.20015 type:complete len:332 (-) Transcript_10664:41-1036(-)